VVVGAGRDASGTLHLAPSLIWVLGFWFFERAGGTPALTKPQ